MRFAEPLAFLALILLPMVLIAHVSLERRRTKELTRAGDPSLLEQMSSIGAERGRSHRAVQAVLFAVALGLVAVALARPQFGMRTEVRKGRGMDLVVALDVSRSMLAKDVVPSRLDRARVELNGLIDSLPGDRIGLVGFTSVALPLCPLTVDHAALKLQLHSVIPADMPRGGTAIADAIRAGKKMLDSSKSTGAGKVVLVVTDGEEHEGDPEAAAKEAKESGIEVHVVGIGSRTGEPIPLVSQGGGAKGYLKDGRGQTVISRLNEGVLERIADAGGGLAALPGPTGGLDLGPVRSYLAQQKKAELDSRTVHIHEERYRWALVPAFVLLLLATILRPRRERIRAGSIVATMVGLLVVTTTPSIQASPFERQDKDVEIGNEALRGGKAEEALEAYEKARSRVGNDPRLALNRGLAQAARGELDQAVNELKIAAASSKEPELRSQALFALGNTYRALKKLDEAVGSYRQSLVEDPTHSGARRNLEIAQAMKRIQALIPKEEDPDGEKSKDPSGDKNDQDKETPDAGTNEDGGPPDAGNQDSSSNQDQPDGGASGNDGGSSGEDTGPSRPDAGTESPPSEAQKPEPEPQELDQQAVQQILDALQEQEKVVKRKRLKRLVKPGKVEKDW